MHHFRMGRYRAPRQQIGASALPFNIVFPRNCVIFRGRELDWTRLVQQQETEHRELGHAGVGARVTPSDLLTSGESATAWDRFQGAMLSLARSGAIKDRLADAFRTHLAQVREEELPREMREEFRAVSRTLTRERPMLRGEDAVRATIRKMSNEEADRIACSVVRMFGALPHNAAARHSMPAQVIPLYATER